MPVLAVVIIAVVVSAALLFLIQPMFARMALPLFGGSPQVWITAMVFFQLVLLAGYAYAHWLSSRLELKNQMLLHGAVLLLPLAFLPIAVTADFVPLGAPHQGYWFLAVLAVSVGVPFFAVSTTGPLLQRWFAHSAHAQAADPYFLYAASNIGSITGLLAYPLLAEPLLELDRQSALWSYGYAALLALSWGLAGMILAARRASATRSAGSEKPEIGGIGRRRALRWLLLAFVPSSLMLGVTAHITTEIAVAPLLWVVPLTLYLLSFTLVFARRNPISHALLARLLPVGAIFLVLLLVSNTNEPVTLALLVNLGFFFIAAMVLHGELARDRPGVRHLTLFYLMMATGGALGGVFNALLGPLVFDALAEYPIAIVLACLLCPPRRKGSPSRWRWTDALPALGIAAAMGLLWLGATPLTRLLGMGGPEFDTLRTGLVVALPLIGCYLLVNRPRRFALALGAWCLVGFAVYEQTRGDLLYADRSFFGVHRVSDHPTHQAHVLRHGFTAHGMQKKAPSLRRTATTYYHASGPAGQVFRSFDARLQRVGIIGLGAGTLATFARPGMAMTFYEIDPVVVEIAGNPELFTFLKDARAAGAAIDVQLGDARLRLAVEPDGSFDLLVVDAFTNDAIPVHLMTREALSLYFRKLQTEGILLLHVSNEHLAVERPLSDVAASLGLFALFQDNPVENRRQLIEGKFHSQWVLMARERALLTPLGESARRWRILAPAGGRVWTDDYSNIVQLILASGPD